MAEEEKGEEREDKERKGRRNGVEIEREKERERDDIWIIIELRVVLISTGCLKYSILY